MKKILAMVMAIVMMMAIAVPAFAGTISNAPGSGESTVKTDASAVGAGTFLVTYPAEMVVAWGVESTPFTYDVETQLAVGKVLTVTVADKENGLVMLNGDRELPYALSGDVTITAEEVTDTTKTINVDIAKADWDAVAIGDYSDIVTFSAAISDKA